METAIVLQLFVITTCKCSINPIIQNNLHSHGHNNLESHKEAVVYFEVLSLHLAGRTEKPTANLNEGSAFPGSGSKHDPFG
jgi:hypothetical protein